MVNQGPSKGCLNCRQARVKCDERTPVCGRCAIKSSDCVYGKAPLKIRFKHETRHSQAGASNELTQAEQLVVAPSRHNAPPEMETVLAQNYFIKFIATMGRSRGCGNGMFESIISISQKEGRSTSLDLALEAISSFFFGRFNRSLTAITTSQARLVQAFQHLRDELADLSMQSMDKILLTILLMQCQETTRAITQASIPNSVHRSGALTLVKSLGLDSFHSVEGKALLLYVFAAEVGSAIQEYRVADQALTKWFDDAKDLPWNHTTRLSQIGVQIASLRADTTRLQQSAGTPRLNAQPVPDQAQQILSNVKDIAHRLQLWTETLPTEWAPFKFCPTRIPSRTLDLYNGMCEVYPSIEIAAMWNTWRLYLIMLCEAQQVVRRTSDRRLSATTATSDLSLQKLDARELVEAICFSAPFHLGDCVSPISPGARISADSVAFPSYNSLDRYGIHVAAGLFPPDLLTEADHVNSALAQGPWQLAIIISQLQVMLLTFDDQTLAGDVRASQLKYVSRQLVRASISLGINE